MKEPTPARPSLSPPETGRVRVGAELAFMGAASSAPTVLSETLRPPVSGGPLRSNLLQSKEVGSVLFDLDDTLYSRRAAFGNWLDTYLRDTLRLTDPTETKHVRDLIASLDRNGYGSKQAIFERLHHLYPTLPGEASRSLDKFFIEFLTHVKPEAETETLLDVLATAGIPFGVITNGSARQWRKIEALGLDKRTSCLFVSETFGVKKPDTAIFHAAADCLGFPPADILFVGDNPTADIIGAHAAGMPAAWLHRGQTWPADLKDKPDFVIGSLSEIAGILRLSST